MGREEGLERYERIRLISSLARVKVGYLARQAVGAKHTAAYQKREHDSFCWSEVRYLVP